MRDWTAGYSPLLLLLFAIFGTLGFFMSFTLQLIAYITDQSWDEGQTYPSGKHYWPASVFETVHNWGAGEGRIFFAFCLLSIFMLFFSWHPYVLSNAFCSEDCVNTCCYIIDWPFFRQFVPTVGLLLVICAGMPPFIQSSTDKILFTIYHIGAFMICIGYAIAECKFLRIYGFTAPANAQPINAGSEEITRRKWLTEFIVIYYAAFCLCQMLLHATTDREVCCHDVFARKWSNFTTNSVSPNSTHTHITGEFTLVDTANGVLLYVKFCSYNAELIAYLLFIGGHMVMWYYCKERVCSCNAQRHLQMHLNYSELARLETCNSRTSSPRTTTVPSTAETPTLDGSDSMLTYRRQFAL